MKIVFQSGIDKPTQELNAQMLQQMTENPATSALIDNYREMKRRMAEAQARHEVDKFVKTVIESDDYQRWLATELKKDKPARTAIAQIKERNYPQQVTDYTGEMLLVGISYDTKTKQHTCQIEPWRKE